MKAKLIIVITLMIIGTGLSAQDAIHDLDFDVQKSSISAVDIDADGDRDILIIGENPNGKFAQLFRNNGEMSFEKVASPFAPSAITSVTFGDVNGDGQLDALQSGFADSVIVNLYTTNESGDLALDDFYSSLAHIAPSSAIADLNNDGHADILIFGNHNIEDQRPKIYFGDGTGGFTSESPFDAYKFIDPKVSTVDVDTDGDLDLWVMAGYEEGIDARFARLFINDGGTFTETDPGIIAKGPGSSDWGDYDGDGDLDLLIGGWGYVNSGEDNDMIYRIYKNTGGTFTEAAVFQPFGAFSPSDASRFADWDNDGDLDVILTGWNPDEGGQRTAFFINTSGTFAAADYNATLPGISESAVAISDLDDDGDLDLIINGYSGNEWNGEGSAYNRNVALVIENTTAGTNAAPAPPANLSAKANGKAVTFSWDEATDDSTPAASLSYNLFLVDSDGNYFYYPLADTTSGKLMVQEKGNMQLNNAWTVKGLPYGEYRWGVQAIDHSFAGSTFAKDNFSHLEGGPLATSLETDALIYPNPNQGQIQVMVSDQIRQLGILTMDGKLVKSLNVETGAKSVQIPMAAGIYLVRALRADGHYTSDKVIVK